MTIDQGRSGRSSPPSLVWLISITVSVRISVSSQTKLLPERHDQDTVKYTERHFYDQQAWVADA